ncbi:DegT/DnrJ/EryC1/StrS family aminotransferase [Chrysosporum ovalisporum Ak1311]|jgi:dTDP-4-amino-4,6-dideoxygalactose transaminase|uniref:DegT/DnrJ/EryC1/StrS family aminotransferase n=3 Tax=Umezakia ovalisporum TaxID=75695 RepID=A0AA43KF56_9CYAN|nr:DegT/DnrJ/EryC1/StrS family aminotransferase [Umezakia ovalisporum]MDH6058701.1 DegT/DnrJ/EryC1/StrS family aminotransferase [Umezakia ovalisporum FSS-43]MDH6064394.1 DegT/DnrJ/EryC1/StrS family aminotransferase [Umezakia ovalisporum FSS-62]MDH6068133.1 DegT/DnrJ/EryC1/StrS family aminotransferase [Umezakia ovalisporum APH033B]MDH6069718.1 DegT/DnrJ/EryC1/StrS family aminotransferase [Umezakia ovalisporum CobakiLakeA]MDH6074753.1 DegT/DnrJ/EryC1/StrS family aminotransferase [Umezakia ovalis
MNMSSKIPFVDLNLQHEPIQYQLQQAIQAVLAKGDFILGKPLIDFEAAFAAASGTEYGVGAASGTDAIALGLQACNIGAADQVILPANTFVATLIGVLRAGAMPVLVDCDPQTALIDLEAAAKAITPQTKAIIPVHLYGQMVSPQQLLDLADTYKLLIFEDAAQAHLAEREGYRAGSVGTAGAFSFYPSKNLGAFGDGGMLLTRDSDVAQKMKHLRNYGASQKYFHVELGTNSRLDTLQAAVLLEKLPHLPQWNRDRLSIAQQYDLELAPLASAGILSMQNHSSTGHVYHLYVIKVDELCVLKRQQIQEKLTAMGIQTGIHYPIPCHLQPAFSHLGYQIGDFPQTEKLANQILSLPMYPGLNSHQIQEVVAAIRSALNDATQKLLFF